MRTETGSIFDRMAALAETTRTRLLLLLEEHEFSVSELCTILQLPQSTVSRHLKVLADEGWLRARAEGTSRRYRMISSRLDSTAVRLWEVVREEAASSPFGQQDAARVQTVLQQRRSTSAEFFSSTAGQWDRLRGELFGERTDLQAVLALLGEDWVIGDLGCGTGRISETLAPFVGRVVAVDDSAAMLAAARKRLAGLPNVVVRRGKIESLPIEDQSLDAATLILVLHYVVEPLRVLEEVARVLKPRGKLLIVDMMPHDRVEYQQHMGHVWPGFDQAELGRWVGAQAFETYRYHPLPADPDATGPSLFVASARRPGEPAAARKGLRVSGGKRHRA